MGGMTARPDTDRADAGCLHCGTHVSERFAAVFGDENDDVHRCPACDSMPRISRGSAAGEFIGSRDDPETEQPERLRGARVRAARAEGGEAAVSVPRDGVCRGCCARRQPPRRRRRDT